MEVWLVWIELLLSLPLPVYSLFLFRTEILLVHDRSQSNYRSRILDFPNQYR
jgi:hypothetical protein